MARNKGSNTKDSDLEYLRGYRRSPLMRSLFWIAILLVVSSFYYLSTLTLDPDSLQRTKTELLRSGGAWEESLVNAYEKQRSWLLKRGTTREVEIYDALSTAILSSKSGVRGSESLSASFIPGILRGVFIVIASWRLWLFAIIAAFIWSRFSLKEYTGKDLLGQTGNGRLFYSGINVGLKQRHSDGTPSKSVIGLACPRQVSEKEVKASNFYRVLNRWKAVNDTTMALAGVILAQGSSPAFVVKKEDTKKLKNLYQDEGLIQHASLILDQALMLSKKYSDGQDIDKDFPGDPKPDNSSYTPSDYAQNLGYMMHRVLTPNLRKSISNLKPSIIAACILGYEAGKSLAFAYEGGEWVKKSNFPQLSARAVIQSLPSYGEDFDLYERQTIRRALIYGARRSSFGPVRFPEDLSLESRALRQWIELCMASPVDLAEVTDEVELFGLVCQGYGRWLEEFYKDISLDTGQEIFATKTNLLFVPVGRIIRQAAKALNMRTIARLDSLVQKLSTKQREYEKKLANTSEEEGLEAIPVYDRITAPLSKEEIANLAKMHDASAKDLRLWSAVRIILNSYGWLSRRVGDYSVPEHSVIFAVLRTGSDAPGANEHGLIGKGAMVPLRGYKLEYKFGRAWQSRFPLSFTATMAESKDIFDKLMQGQSKDDILGHNSAA